MPRLLYLMIGLASSPNHCMLRKPQGQGILLEWMRHSPVWRPRQTICHVAKTARLGGHCWSEFGGWQDQVLSIEPILPQRHAYRPDKSYTTLMARRQVPVL